jgi:hypothetical protein
LLLVGAEARAADPPEDDEPMFAPAIELRDVAPHELFEAPAKSAPLWLSIKAGAALLKDGERSFEAALLLTIPLERLADRRSARATSIGPYPVINEKTAPVLKPAPRSSRPRPEEPASAPAKEDQRDALAPADAPQPSQPEPAPAPLLITPDVARGAAAAALKHARLVDAAARVDALASRARAAALLPELRLRASRLVDEAQNLSPTEYDPGRITASGGTSVWLEARATWRLDRLLVADEEVALERMRHDRAEAQAKLVDKVIELLFAWQRAIAKEATVTSRDDPEARAAAALAAAEAEAMLDVLTDGWFTRWLGKARAQGAKTKL